MLLHSNNAFTRQLPNLRFPTEQPFPDHWRKVPRGVNSGRNPQVETGRARGEDRDVPANQTAPWRMGTWGLLKSSTLCFRNQSALLCSCTSFQTGMEGSGARPCIPGRHQPSHPPAQAVLVSSPAAPPSACSEAFLTRDTMGTPTFPTETQIPQREPSFMHLGAHTSSQGVNRITQAVCSAGPDTCSACTQGLSSPRTVPQALQSSSQAQSLH